MYIVFFSPLAFNLQSFTFLKIFFNNQEKSVMDAVKISLMKRNISVSSTHKDMTTTQRSSELKEFIVEKTAMITSNGFSRGIHIPKATVAINFDIPDQHTLDQPV